ncbi:NAD(P)/FAD-dependent oxidoreductase [Aurantiacibacter gangjinensis]|uniref:Deoxyribodipyrimidine photolyase n=1 Tax=Aurantiacibacter gangjinensis TaxID=502682 RepID=A0A0G9MR42_9SPHN|nr:NAD(P)-binding protein [Aurantiacibacter gangjinensis]APE29088.1 Amine oxidase, flavin-containing [Aurantiacibacter gangjinensis]KLE33177.1 deoxyribodipyrimidine photolyase [Aurantiacibacter gangjinensis]
MPIAIVGAGMAGLTCASRLAEAGRAVRVFDKGRGPGGRMSARRVELDGETLHFDHGAQYFTARDERFRRQVERWHGEGVIAPWPAAKDGAWVGTPAMNAPIRVMADALGVQFGARVEAIRADESGWVLEGDGLPDEAFATVICAVPAEQVAPLFARHHNHLAELAQATVSDPCWTVMAAFDGRVDLNDTIHDAGAIGWAARNNSKPGRAEPECWVIQGSPDWSREYLEEEAEAVVRLLLEEFRTQAGGALPPLRHAAAHRWRYARSGDAGEGAIWDADKRIGACGDWLKGPRVECAFLSGWELAEAILKDG